MAVATQDGRSNIDYYKRYLSKRKWYCEKSPTGAHHWVIGKDTMECRWCKRSRKVRTQELHRIDFDKSTDNHTGESDDNIIAEILHERHS